MVLTSLMHTPGEAHSQQKENCPRPRSRSPVCVRPLSPLLPKWGPLGCLWTWTGHLSLEPDHSSPVSFTTCHPFLIAVGHPCLEEPRLPMGSCGQTECGLPLLWPGGARVNTAQPLPPRGTSLPSGSFPSSCFTLPPVRSVSHPIWAPRTDVVPVRDGTWYCC